MQEGGESSEGEGSGRKTAEGGEGEGGSQKLGGYLTGYFTHRGDSAWKRPRTERSESEIDTEGGGEANLIVTANPVTKTDV